MPGRKSPYGIHVDSPDQRQWMSFEPIGSIRRMAWIVWGAASSQRAVKWRSPTSILSNPTHGAYVPEDAPQAPSNGTSAAPGAPTISTHVLDTELGKPAAGVHVTLSKLGEDDRPIRLTQALTDEDGRIRDLLERPLSPGTYRIEFALATRDDDSTGRFFRRLSVDLLVEDVSRSYHVPILLAPFSLTTYRGS